MEETVFSCKNKLVVFTSIPELLAMLCSHAAEKFSSRSKINFANRCSKKMSHIVGAAESCPQDAGPGSGFVPNKPYPRLTSLD
jgi:hypothetical protein